MVLHKQNQAMNDTSIYKRKTDAFPATALWHEVVGVYVDQPASVLRCLKLATSYCVALPSFGGATFLAKHTIAELQNNEEVRRQYLAL